MLLETSTRGKPQVQPGGDLAHTREHGLQRGDLGVGQGNGMLPRLTHILEGDRAQAGRDCVQTRKRGGGGPVIPPMPATGYGKESMHRLIFHELGQAKFVSSRRETAVRGK